MIMTQKKSVQLEDFSSNPYYLNLKDPEIFQFKDIIQYFRCFTLKIPKNTTLYQLAIQFSTDTEIYIHSQGFFNQKQDLNLLLMNNDYAYAILNYEAFKVLDFGSEECKIYGEKSRNHCLQEAIAEVRADNSRLVFVYIR